MNEMCFYCGEEKAQVEIITPNFDETGTWKVCETCKRIIKNQTDLTIGMFLKTRENPVAEKLSDKLIKRAEKNLKEISYESGKEIFSVEVTK